MKIATWNVNSIKARLPNVTEWLKEFQPDIVLLQELKITEENFPTETFDELGYNSAAAGQKTYNGVAILSKLPMEVDLKVLPGNEDDPQARYIEAGCYDEKGNGIRVASIYLPNGNPFGTEKFDYKLTFLDRLYRHAQNLLKSDEAFVLGGDYNVVPQPEDVFDPEGWAEDNEALFRPESRAGYRRLLNLGLTDAIATTTRDGGNYTWWDYKAGAWQKNNGARIDHLLLSPQAADRLKDAGIDRTPRGKQKPSDHTPVWCELEDAA